MPKMVSEIAQGQSYEFSASESEVAARQVRVFRLIKSAPDEYINLFEACGVFIGDIHPQNQELYCESVSAQYEGESRMVLLVTFNYRVSVSFEMSSGGAGADRLSKPPDIRPANWYITSSLTESPAFSWRRSSTTTDATPQGAWETITNPAGDLYEGVSKMEAIITIHVEQWVDYDPTKHAKYAGYVNENVLTLGSLDMNRRTVMFRGVQTRPTVEQYNNRIYRGWTAQYEFLYRKNVCQVSDASTGALAELAIGWDRAQPQSGFNIINKYYPKVSDAEDDDVEAGSLLLAREEVEGGYGLKIKGWPNELDPAEGTGGEKTRGMILVADGKWPTQRPCAQPIPLNDDGTPRWSRADPPVLVYRYQVQPEINFQQKLQLRLMS